MNTIIKISLFVLLFCALSACAKLEVRSKQDQISSTLNSYIAILRWQLLDASAFHINEEKVPYVLKDIEKYEEIRVVRAALLDISTNDEVDQAIVQIEIAWANERTQRVKNEQFQHLWWYDEETKRWYNKSPFPELP